jgi:conjugal transfer mating pair stabilization protein TraG
MPFIGWLFAGIGGFLLLSGLQGRNPLAELKAALRGENSPGKEAFKVKVAATSGTGPAGSATLDPLGMNTGGSSGALIRPISGPITSGYGMRGNRMHHGVDIPAATNTPIKAAASGVVLTNSYEGGGAGNYVTLKHSGGLYTKYFHMVRRSDLPTGTNVTGGQVIGYVGSTGNSSGPHLHFEVHEGGSGFGNANSVDPRKYIS